MGRIFETRKHTMFARWDKMAKAFARIGKEITIAVKAGGPNPDDNPPLRRVIQNARAVNMPKDKVEAAIKRASGQDAADYEEILYEGYAPHGVAVIVETATDNPTRTVRQRPHPLQQGRRQPRQHRQRRLPVQAHGRLPPRARGHRPGGARARPDRPRPRGDGRERPARRASRSSSSAAPSPTSARCRRRSRTASITPISAESEYIPHDPGRAPRGPGRPRCSSWSTRSSRTTTSRRSSTTSPDLGANLRGHPERSEGSFVPACR